MKQAFYIAIAVSLLAFASHAISQNSSNSSSPKPLVLMGSIPLPHVHGRIDHFAFDPKGRLFVSALGNDTEEVIDTSAGRVTDTITGIPRPQGVAFVPELNKIFVGSDEGKLYIYDGASYQLITSIDFGDDVDNLRYDPGSKRVYVGYGDEHTGAIGMVDSASNQRLPEEFRLGAHPESFQLEQSGPNIYVNVPDRKQVAVINRSTRKISRWPLSLEGNFPMALDEVEHRLFVVTRSPARLLVLDTGSGHQVAVLPCVQDSDDAYYDPERKRLYVTGGEGYISVFQQKDPDHYEQLAKMPSGRGARTSGYFGRGRKGFQVFYVAVPARPERGAEVLRYTVQD